MTQFLNALYLSQGNLSKMASLLRDHSPDMISTTIFQLTQALDSTSSSTKWTVPKRARYILRCFSPLPRPTVSSPPAIRPTRRRITIRLVPTDDDTARAVRDEGGHPFLEIVLRDNKAVWDIVAHLFSKWSIPVNVYIHGNLACIRSRLATFILPSTQPQDTTEDLILNATYQVSDPRIPPSVFKAARAALLLPDAPPPPPPLPPLPPLSDHCSRSRRPEEEWAANAVPSPLIDIDNFNSTHLSPSISGTLATSATPPLPSSHSTSVTMSVSLCHPDAVLSPTFSFSKSPAPPPLPPLPSLPVSVLSNPVSCSTNKSASNLEVTRDSAKPDALPSEAGLSVHIHPSSSTTDHKDCVSASGMLDGNENARTEVQCLKRSARDIQSGGRGARVAKRRRVFVADKVDRHEHVGSPHMLSSVDCSGAMTPTMSVSNESVATSLQDIQRAVDPHAHTEELAMGEYSDLEVEIPDNSFEGSFLDVDAISSIFAPLSIPTSLRIDLDEDDVGVGVSCSGDTSHSKASDQEKIAEATDPEITGSSCVSSIPDMSESQDIVFPSAMKAAEFTNIVDESSDSFENGGNSVIKDSVELMDEAIAQLILAHEHAGLSLCDQIDQSEIADLSLSHDKQDEQSSFDSSELDAFFTF